MEKAEGELGAGLHSSNRSNVLLDSTALAHSHSYTHRVGFALTTVSYGSWVKSCLQIVDFLLGYGTVTTTTVGRPQPWQTADRWRWSSCTSRLVLYDASQVSGFMWVEMFQVRFVGEIVPKTPHP